MHRLFEQLTLLQTTFLWATYIGTSAIFYHVYLLCPQERPRERNQKWDDVCFGERTITLKAQRSCVQSFAKLVERLEKPLFEILYTQTRDFHLAQDFMREIFVKPTLK